MVLVQETDTLVAEPVVLFITLDNQLMPSTFVARSITGLLSYHLQQMLPFE